MRKHFRRGPFGLAELTSVEIEALKADGRYYFSPENIETEDGREEVDIQWPDEEIDKRKAEEATPPSLPPFQKRVQLAFEALSDEKQDRFEDLIIKGAFYLERNNLRALGRIITKAEESLVLPGDEDVKAIIEAAKAELGAA